MRGPFISYRKRADRIKFWSEGGRKRGALQAIIAKDCESFGRSSCDNPGSMGCLPGNPAIERRLVEKDWSTAASIQANHTGLCLGKEQRSECAWGEIKKLNAGDNR